MEENCRKKKQFTIQQLIYNRLVNYLVSDHRFTAKGLNRQTLASALKTNEKLLCIAVREYSEDKTLARMIGHMRMRYAVELLMKHSDYTVEAVARECGFKSRCAFYQMFERHYQCTPVDFRQKALSKVERQTELGELSLEGIDPKQLKTGNRMKWKLKSEMLIQQVGDEKVLLVLNKDVADFSQVIRLNGTAAHVIETMKEEPCTIEELAMSVCQRYEVNKEDADRDVRGLVEELSAMHIIDEFE